MAASVWATTIGTNIDSSGTIGAATTTPWGDAAVDQIAGQTKLHPVFVVGDNGTTSPHLFVSQKGRVGLGTRIPSLTLDIRGNAAIGANAAAFATGTMSSAITGALVAIPSNSGTTISFGTYSRSDLATNIAATNNFGVYVANPTIGGGSSISNTNYGLYIENITGGGAESFSLTAVGRSKFVGMLQASSTVLVGSHFINYGKAFLGGTTSQAIFENSSLTVGKGLDNSDIAHAYIEGGLGVNNATSSQGDFIVGGGAASSLLSYTNNGRLVVGASTTAATAGDSNNKFIFDGGDMSISSGGTGTTTLGIYNEAGANGKNACIEMSTDGVLYRVFINAARTGLTVQAGSCKNS